MRTFVLLCLTIALNSCHSVENTFQRIAADLTLVEQSNISTYSPFDSLVLAIHLVDSLQTQADQILPIDDPKRLETPYSQILNRLVTYQQHLEDLQQNASLYNIGAELQRLITQPKLPIAAKMENTQEILRIAPNYYEQAKLKLIHPDTSSLQLAIRKQILGIHFLNNNYPDSLIKAQLMAEPFDTLVEECRFAMKDYIAWCNSQIIEQSQ